MLPLNELQDKADHWSNNSLVDWWLTDRIIRVWNGTKVPHYNFFFYTHWHEVNNLNHPHAILQTIEKSWCFFWNGSKKKVSYYQKTLPRALRDTRTQKPNSSLTPHIEMGANLGFWKSVLYGRSDTEMWSSGPISFVPWFNGWSCHWNIIV